ncbi:hypothetical protein BG842_13895 [Haladaptatus sp. W1]|uniref:hypothetical protein n=1 Tax=Haladaptatus sp. W1 TaxID=1897478 RepID=UPI000849CF66|nr:hypothetical protein [Haladaptatus sp. W1]ODR79631.1 hypothetical protein BG842_13895 [Haladaptatus sp. W1]
MCANQFSPALSQVLGSEARCDLFAVLVERRDEWLTAAEWCDRAGVSRSGFHRDHKSLFLGFDLVALRDGGSDASTHPTYSLADIEQDDLLADLHYALEDELENTGPLLSAALEGFVR